MMEIKKDIFEQPLQIVNIGLMSFYESVKTQDVTCIHVDWKPPAGGDEKLLAILSRLQQQT